MNDTARHTPQSVAVETFRSPMNEVRASVELLSFAAGARTAWCSHPQGQTLIVVSGSGQVQCWGEAVQKIEVGDVVHIPAHVRHWHGAGSDAAMSRIAITDVRKAQASGAGGSGLSHSHSSTQPMMPSVMAVSQSLLEK